MMMFMIEITVSGNGRFPVDMLRYDRCWPATEKDADSIARGNDASVNGEDRVVTLNKHQTSPAPFEVTDDRWRSFGWTVVGIRRLRT